MKREGLYLLNQRYHSRHHHCCKTLAVTKSRPTHQDCVDSRKLADRIQLYDSQNQFRWICYLSSVRFVTGFQNYHKLIDILPRWDPLGWMKAFKSLIWVYFHLPHVLKVCLKLAGRGVRQQFGGRKNCDKNWLQLLRCYERYTRGNGGYTPYSFIQFQF